MLFSCKISHSILTYLDRQGADLTALFEACEYPSEFLRNPSHWLEAQKLEDLLGFIMREYKRLAREDDLITEAGHACKDLRSWGVLDSVLRMVQSPKDIFAQPDRFMSYFVSPAPPVANVLREPEAVFFELPIAATQYPLVTTYLRAAFEALPTYVGKPMASCTWSEIRVAIHWSEDQESLFTSEQDEATHLNPDVVRGVVANLEQTQKQLEETKALLASRELELKALKSAAVQAVPRASGKAQTSQQSWFALAQGLKAEVTQPAQAVLNDVFRLSDYLARAQQLVTLLVAQGRQSAQVTEAMRRVDWDFVKTETPVVVKQAAAGVRRIQEIVQDLSLLTDDNGELTLDPNLRKVPTNINQLVSKAIESSQGQFSVRHSIDQHLLLDRDVPVLPKPMEKAFSHLIKNALQAIDGEGSVRIVTRPSGARAEVEISDTGVGMNENVLDRALEPFFTTQNPGTAAGLGMSLAHAIIRGHDGSLNVKSEPGRGTTIVISLPLEPR